jgi:hypothetical protein
LAGEAGDYTLKIFFAEMRLHLLFVNPNFLQADTAIQGYLRRKKTKKNQTKTKRGDCMPTSKKQLVKLNQVKKAKAEELSKQAAEGSKTAKKKLKKLEKKLK